MPNIEIRNLTKNFNGFTAVNSVNLNIADGEYVTLLGPSGCGKSTLLRCIAGLLNPTSGEIIINRIRINDLLPEDRNIGFLFQNYALFPHMNISENVGYGPVVRGMVQEDVEKITKDMLNLVMLLDKAGFFPERMSGGMQQRIALVRALATGSRILLLDEPFSTLDAKIGSALRYEIQKTAKKIGLTVLHVTHDQEEAMTISDKIVVMKRGRIIQSGTPNEIYNHPSTSFVAHFIGESNFIAAKRVSNFSAKFDDTTLDTIREIKENESDVILAIRPEKILFEKRIGNTVDGIIEDINFLGDTTRYEINLGSRSIFIKTAKRPDLKIKNTVSIYLSPKDIMIFPYRDLEKELEM